MQNAFTQEVQIVYLRETKKLYMNAGLAYATTNSAGLDLRASIHTSIIMHPQERNLIPTGISIAMPANMMAAIYSRSGLGAKHGIIITQGVGIIDADYRGEIFIALCNISDTPYTINNGDRIAQIIFQEIIHPTFKEVVKLDDTERGSGAFGHSGTE